MPVNKLETIETAVQITLGQAIAPVTKALAEAQKKITKGGWPTGLETPGQLAAFLRVQSDELDSLVLQEARLMANTERVDKAFKEILAATEGLEPQVNDAINTALGLAGQAVKLFIDTETGAVIRGRKIGELSPAAVRLAGVIKPGEEVTPSDIAGRLGIKPGSVSSTLNRIQPTETGDLIILPLGKGKYTRNPALTILGEEPPPAASVQRFYGAQIVAGLENVGIGALKTLQQAGILKEGLHFDVTGSGRRVYRPEAKPIVQRLDKAAAAAPIGRITREFVLKTFPPPKEVKSTDQPAWENPYGPNGPRAANNDLVEFVIARAINDCLRPDESHPQRLTPLEIKTGHSPTEQTIRLAGEIAMRLVVLEGRLGLGEEKTDGGKLYPDEYKTLELPEGGKSAANRLAAAAIMELAQNARPFNFIRRERPTYEFALTLVRGLKEIGRPDLIEVMAQNLANPKSISGQGTWSGGVETVNHSSPLG